tara:strand:- start:584 stop:871 length:288 start_codon:yes stop_codon:yes gene_type:complete
LTGALTGKADFVPTLVTGLTAALTAGFTIPLTAGLTGVLAMAGRVTFRTGLAFGFGTDFVRGDTCLEGLRVTFCFWGLGSVFGFPNPKENMAILL